MNPFLLAHVCQCKSNYEVAEGKGRGLISLCYTLLFGLVDAVSFVFSILSASGCVKFAHVGTKASFRSFSVPAGSLEPHLLVLLAHCLAVADYFPEELVREIFTIEFLGKLDAHLESMSPPSVRSVIVCSPSFKRTRC